MRGGTRGVRVPERAQIQTPTFSIPEAPSLTGASLLLVGISTEKTESILNSFLTSAVLTGISLVSSLSARCFAVTLDSQVV